MSFASFPVNEMKLFVSAERNSQISAILSETAMWSEYLDEVEF